MLCGGAGRDDASDGGEMTKEFAIEYIQEECEDCPQYNAGECLSNSHCFEVKQMAIKALREEDCEDAISRKSVTDTTICDGISCNECSFNEIDGESGCLLQKRVYELPRVKPVAGVGKVEFDEKKMQEIVHEVAGKMVEECGDAISRAELKMAYHNFYNGLRHTPTEEDIIAYVDAMPSIRPIRPKGEWISYHFGTFYVCSCCNERNNRRDKFCPNCGADMRGKADEESNNMD